MPIVLWTDALVFLSIITIITTIYWIICDPQLRGRWQQVLQKPSCCVAAIVFAAFVIIGTLDSMHYVETATNTINSLLDWLLRPISQIQETSYSAPFARHLLNKEIVINEDGQLNWTAPKLIYNYHVFGTDKIGIDVLYASLKSVRTGLVIGFLTTIFTLPFAIFFGAAAGYFGGKIDDVIQYIYTTISSIPAVLLIAASMLSLDGLIANNSTMFNFAQQRSDARLLLLCAILGLTSWTSLCRMLRAETLKIRTQEFILSAKALGASNWRIIWRHVLPNLLHIILIAIVLDFSGLVLSEAVLTYIGVGVDPTMFSWGNIINSARLEMGCDPIIWWTLAGAFVLMFSLVLAANIFADEIRTVFDSRA
mgnify:CR=1 FL=1